MTTTLKYSHMNEADAFLRCEAEPIDFSLAGDNVLISGIRDSQIAVYRIFFVTDGNTDLIFKNGLSDDLTGPIPMTANGSLSFDITNIPWFQTSKGNDFILNSSNSVQVSGVIYYQRD